MADRTVEVGSPRNDVLLGGAADRVRADVGQVMAHRDPGHANWLETAGHARGTMCFRWVGAKEHVHPTARVVKFSKDGRFIKTWGRH